MDFSSVQTRSLSPRPWRHTREITHATDVFLLPVYTRKGKVSHEFTPTSIFFFSAVVLPFVRIPYRTKHRDFVRPTEVWIRVCGCVNYWFRWLFSHGIRTDEGERHLRPSPVRVRPTVRRVHPPLSVSGQEDYLPVQSAQKSWLIISEKKKNKHFFYAFLIFFRPKLRFWNSFSMNDFSNDFRDSSSCAWMYVKLIDCLSECLIMSTSIM